jgi:hypothetical protein
MGTAVLSHVQHLVVILCLDALLDESILCEVTLIVEIWQMLLQEETGLDVVFQNVHVVILSQFS